MKVIQIGHTDLIGTRFNGRDLHRHFQNIGVESHMCVWIKQSAEPDIWQLGPHKWRWIINDVLLSGIEKRLSLQSLLYPYPCQLYFDKRFRRVDIAHYHLIHSKYFSLLNLPLLSRMKPSVWTLHDPWAMTGHCIYPYDCNRWMTGCGNCPRLDTTFPLRDDRTALLWKIKKAIYHASKIDIVLASKWMFNMASQSPLLSRFRLHHIPFGIDLNVFRPMDTDEAKRQMGVIPGSLVICFRSTNYEYKGIDFIRESLRKLKIDRPVCLLTFNERGIMDEFRGRYQIIDLGWVNDESLTVKAYNAADIFLMPSTAEAFGMMAIEAMACGKPVIVFDGTSLPEIVFAPQGGIAVPQGDTDALLAALERLSSNPVERLEIGVNALALARQHYDFKSHAERILGLYDEVIKRRACER